MQSTTSRHRLKRWGIRLGLGLLLLAGILAIPDCSPAPPPAAGGEPFVWDQDEIWTRLEQSYRDAREHGCQAAVTPHFEALESDISGVAARAPGPEDPAWATIETNFFQLAAQVAACDEQVARLAAARVALRRAAKDAARGWPQERFARDRLYRLLYGTRTAVEEVMLAAASGTDAALILGAAEPSQTPSTLIQGVRIHSGDLLLSRGGAPTSAFIARGNDYPGNFSHVAMAHVDEAGTVSVIEAHIERGVAIADVEAYMADKKLRIAVLRLRSDHPALAADPLLPHRAATAALEEARRRHIPYDFAMNYQHHDGQFCSEVASAAYERKGVELWQHLSTFSSPGLGRWMASFGVRSLETLAPSDLEYDPQLRVVAEWRDIDTLFDDHVDNSIIDAMLEGAERGDTVEYSAVLLPAARLAKGYSLLLNAFGSEGPIPEGMSATTALRAQWLAERHAALKEQVLEAAEAHRAEHGYRPPYWRLVELARAASTS